MDWNPSCTEDAQPGVGVVHAVINMAPNAILDILGIGMSIRQQ